MFGDSSVQLLWLEHESIERLHVECVSELIDDMADEGRMGTSMAFMCSISTYYRMWKLHGDEIGFVK
jgi:hypothetical protein